MLRSKYEALVKDEQIVINEIKQLEDALNNKLAYLNKIKGGIETVVQLINEEESRQRDKAEIVENLQEDSGRAANASGEASEEG